MSAMPPPPPPPGVPPPQPPPPPGAVPGGSPLPTGYAGQVAVQPYGRPLGNRRSTGLVILLSIVTCGIWIFVWAYQNGDELNRWSGKGLGGALHLVITIFVSPVTMFLLASEVEQLYRDDGQQPRITAVWGLWFLLPLIGNIIWYVRIQDAINVYWTAHGQTNNPGL